MKKLMRAIALLLCISIVASVFSFGVFAGMGVHHNCSDGHCPICYALQLLEKLKDMLGLFPELIFCGSLYAGTAVFLNKTRLPEKEQTTPVSLKVKISA